MSKTLCLLNSPELGGAERSFLTQLGLLTNKNEMDIFAPSVGMNQPGQHLKDYLAENNLNFFGSFEYDEHLYSTSRSEKSFNILNIFIGLIEQVLRFKILNFFDYQKIWCNGNKVFIPVFLGAIFFRYKGTLVWHWRDYPIKGKLNSAIHFLYKKLGTFQLIFVGNSCSVCEEIKIVFPKVTLHRLYNPVKFDVTTSLKKSRGVLGFAGMSAPWKGLHELYFWASLYESQL